jgi:ribosomal-protein-serine acetyltransferase
MEYLLVDDHIHLQLLKPSHSDLIYEAICRNREFLRIWLPFVDQTRKPRDTELFVKQISRNQEKTGDFVYTIWYKGEFAGLAGFKDTDTVNNKTEIGYWLIEPMQAKGIMTKTVKKLVDYAFRNLDLNRIQIKTATGNDRSAGIPRRLGFTLEGLERNGERNGNHYRDLEVYSLLKREWIDRLLSDFP